MHEIPTSFRVAKILVKFKLFDFIETPKLNHDNFKNTQIM